MSKPFSRSWLGASMSGYLLTDPLFQQHYLELLFDRLRPLRNASVPKPDQMTFEGFVNTMKGWNPALFEQWKCIVRDKYCSSPEIGAIHSGAIPLFPRYMLHVALRLEESEGLEDYTQAVLALKRYLESHGKSVSEELRRSPLADMVHDELVLHGKSSMVVEPRTAGKSHHDDFQLDYYRYIANDVRVPNEHIMPAFSLSEERHIAAQEQLNANAAKLFEKLARQEVKP